MSRRAVHFGAGNIGRGFLGQLYFESGYVTTFVDVVEEVVAALHKRRAYPLRIVGENTASHVIEGVDAVDGRDLDEVARVLAEADLVSTAVGVGALPHIAPAIARGLERRFSDAYAPALNIIICENLLDASEYLRERVRAHLAPEFHGALDEKTGFVEASIGRMVPVMTDAQKAEDLLLVCAEPYCELPVDAEGFKGSIPPLAHLLAKKNFAAYVERKLFVHNLSHAATAYLGHLRGHEFIWQAVEDPPIRAEVEAATVESCAALAAKHGLDRAELEEHRLDLLQRYANRALGDQVSRVARDPIRKLGPKDRLVGAARLCQSQNLSPEHIAFAIAAGFQYHDGLDPAAKSLQDIRRQQGLAGAIHEVCGVPLEDPIVDLILAAEKRLLSDGWLD